MIYFIYSDIEQDTIKESVLNDIFKKVSSKIVLPENIEIEFKNLGKTIYAETLLDHRYKTRVRLNAVLSVKELFRPFIHELVHLNQTHSGKLGVYRNGTPMWEGKPYITSKPISELTYKEHSQLPWEQEASFLETRLLQEILKDY